MDSKKKKDKLIIQSIIFGKGWKLDAANKWLNKNKYKPMGKVNKLKSSLKFIIEDEKKFKKLSFRKTKRGIGFILGEVK